MYSVFFLLLLLLLLLPLPLRLLLLLFSTTFALVQYLRITLYNSRYQVTDDVRHRTYFSAKRKTGVLRASAMVRGRKKGRAGREGKEGEGRVIVEERRDGMIDKG